MFKVVEKFADLQDCNHLYEVGDTYPREGVLPLPERVEELASNKNRLHIPLIVEIPDKAVPQKRKKKAK